MSILNLPPRRRSAQRISGEAIRTKYAPENTDALQFMLDLPWYFKDNNIRKQSTEGEKQCVAPNAKVKMY